MSHAGGAPHQAQVECVVRGVVAEDALDNLIVRSVQNVPLTLCAKSGTVGTHPRMRRSSQVVAARCSLRAVGRAATSKDFTHIIAAWPQLSSC